MIVSPDFYLGCEPVGVADRNRIPDARITASSIHDTKYHPYYGRLHESRGKGGWCPKKKPHNTEYLQVDMREVRSVCAVATQGLRGRPSWSTSYKLRLSTDGKSWKTYKETNKEKVRMKL